MVDYKKKYLKYKKKYLKQKNIFEGGSSSYILDLEKERMKWEKEEDDKYNEEIRNLQEQINQKLIDKKSQEIEKNNRRTQLIEKESRDAEDLFNFIKEKQAQEETARQIILNNQQTDSFISNKQTIKTLSIIGLITIMTYVFH